MSCTRNREAGVISISALGMGMVAMWLGVIAMLIKVVNDLGK